MFTDSFALRAKKTENSDLTELFKLAEQPDVISFAGGFPDPEWFLEDINEITLNILKNNRDTALQYSPVAGFTSVREFIAQRMTQQKMAARVNNIMITSGSLQGLDLLCRIFLDPGDSVVIEAPTYLGAISTFETYEANLITIPCDQHGLDVDALEEHLKTSSVKPKFLYVIPTFQNPSGRVWNLERRQRLIEICTRFQLPIIEDNAYGELRCTGEDVPTLKSLDQNQLVIYLGTFSKILFPGIRLGWVAASNDIIEKLILFKQNSDQTSSSLSQLIALETGKSGMLDKQIKVNIENLQIKRDVTIKNLEKYFAGKAKWTVSEGGYYTWVTIERDINTYELLQKAVKDYKVAYVAGPSFYPGRKGGINSLRMCYSLPKPDQIEEGIKRLAEVFLD